MKRLFLSLLLSLQLCFAAVSSNTEWDVRTTGSDNNGGFFVNGATGTDFSQQNAAQYTFADLASANGSTNPCTVTSASHNFVAADVGNGMHISAGTNWTASWYQIVSVAANAATLDRACGSVAALTSGTYFVGGSLATVSQAGTNVQSATINGAGGSISGTVNVQTGTYTLTTAIALSNFVTAWVGYNATHGDNGSAPTITTATNSTNLFTMSGQASTWDNFIFTNTAATPAIGISCTAGNFCGIRNSSFSGFTNGVNSVATETHLIGVEVKNSTLVGVAGGGQTTVIFGSWIHNNTGNNVDLGHVTLVNSIISAGTAGGVRLNASPGTGSCISSNVANNGTFGISGTGSSFSLIDCNIYGNGTNGIIGPGTASPGSTPVNIGRNNGYGANTSGDLSAYTAAPGPMNGTNKALNDVAFTASPFTGATNFALNSTAGGGPIAAGTGWPGTFPGGLTTSTMNIGATQSSSAGGGGGSGGGTIIYIK